MKTSLLYLFTRTPLHIGAGASVGAIDQTIIRERHTGFPVIPGSSIKGVIADSNGATSNANEERSEKNRRLFGSTQTDEKNALAGGISFGEAKLLLFAARAAQGCFTWITCPLALTRWATATNRSLPDIPRIELQNAYADAMTLGSAANKGVIEDTLISIQGKVPEKLLEEIKKVFEKVAPGYASLLPTHLALVSNDVFAHLVATCCEIQQHVKIDDTTGTAAGGALFNQENVPAECLFYSALVELRPNTMADLVIPKVLQLGADATTGLGFCDAIKVNVEE